MPEQTRRIFLFFFMWFHAFCFHYRFLAGIPSFVLITVIKRCTPKMRELSLPWKWLLCLNVETAQCACVLGNRNDCLHVAVAERSNLHWLINLKILFFYHFFFLPGNRRGVSKEADQLASGLYDDSTSEPSDSSRPDVPDDLLSVFKNMTKEVLRKKKCSFMK